MKFPLKTFSPVRLVSSKYWCTQTAFVALIVLLLVPSFSSAGNKSALELFGSQRKYMVLGSPGFSNPRFSPDGKLLAFDVCDKGRCENAIYDIAKDSYFAYRDKQDRRITNVSFSPSGQKLTFVVKGWKGFLWWAEPQDRIVVGSTWDNRFTFVTYPEGAKRYPEFWGEEAVLFIGEDPTGTGRRKSKFLYMVGVDGKTVRPLFKDFHKYKDVNTGLPRTRPLSFYGPSRPRAHWDAKHIVLADYAFSRMLVPYTERQNIKFQNEVLRISIADETVAPMPIAVVEPYHPAMAMVAKRFYVASRFRDNAGVTRDVHDVFMVNKDKVKRVSQLSVYIYDMDVNPDGSLLALVVQTPDRAFMNGRLLLYDTSNHSYRELKPKAVSELRVHIDDITQR